MGNAKTVVDRKPSPLEAQLPNVEIDEIIRRQGVKPITSLEDFAKLWPQEHDPDAFSEWYRAYKADNRSRPQKEIL